MPSIHPPDARSMMDRSDSRTCPYHCDVRRSDINSRFSVRVRRSVVDQCQLLSTLMQCHAA